PTARRRGGAGIGPRGALTTVICRGGGSPWARRTRASRRHPMTQEIADILEAAALARYLEMREMFQPCWGRAPRRRVTRSVRRQRPGAVRTIRTERTR